MKGQGRMPWPFCFSCGKLLVEVIEMQNFCKFIFLLAFLLAPLEGAWARRPVQKIKIQGELKIELNALLKATVDLQEASFKGIDTNLNKATKNLLSHLNATAKKAHLAKEQKPHLLKILQAASTNLEKSRRAVGSDRHTFFQKTFSQLVIIAQMYQLDPYKIFFCPKDKSVWFQRNSKPQNPVNPETFGDCGKPVT